MAAKRNNRPNAPRLDTLARMAVSGTTEFDVAASPEQVFEAVAAIEDLPKRSSAH